MSEILAEEYFIYTNKKGQTFYLHERKTKQTLIGRSYHIYYFNHELRQDEENNSLKEVLGIYRS